MFVFLTLAIAFNVSQLFVWYICKNIKKVIIINGCIDFDVFCSSSYNKDERKYVEQKSIFENQIIVFKWSKS